MALKLSLKPGERFVINGAVIANGDRRSSLILHNRASILREKDIMQEHEADSPAKRIYFPIMLMYIDGSDVEHYYDEFVLRITEFMAASKAPGVLDLCVQISKEVMNRNYYKAVINCKKLIAYEMDVLANVTENLPEHAKVG